jgi:GPH family glycoside/pentoside/hexuronide:cation symporter
VARFLDAFTDITIGRIVDRSHPKKDGKFRPWIRKVAVPVALISFLMYQSAVASAPMGLRIAYMFTTYLLWGSIFYTAINIPYGSMASAITDDADGRASLSIFRSIGSVFANIIIGVIVPLFVYTTDENGNQIVQGERFTITAAVLAVLTVVCYLLCYLLTEERVVIEPSQKKRTSVLDTFGALIKSRALVGIVVATVAILAAQLLGQSINQYLFIDYFKSKNGAALMSAAGMLPGILISPAAVPLTRRFGKREIGIFGSLCGALSCFLLYFMRTRSVLVYIAVNIIGFLGFSLFNLIMWAFITDIIDDSEVKNGVREDATIYGAYSFARKIGQAIAGGLGGFALGFIGFDSSAQVQTEQVANGIYTLATLIPAMLYLIVGASLAFLYPLTKRKVEENTQILKSRKKENEDTHA